MMNRRALVTTLVVATGFIPGCSAIDDPDGESDTNETADPDSTSTDGTLGTRIAYFDLLLLGERDVPSQISVSPWPDSFEDVSVLDHLAALAIGTDRSRGQGQTREVEYEVVTMPESQYTPEAAEEAAEALDSYRQNVNADLGYPHGWYFELADEVVVVSYGVDE